jgi:hypothetical protein
LRTSEEGLAEDGKGDIEDAEGKADGRKEVSDTPLVGEKVGAIGLGQTCSRKEHDHEEEERGHGTDSNQQIEEGEVLLPLLEKENGGCCEHGDEGEKAMHRIGEEDDRSGEDNK